MTVPDGYTVDVLYAWGDPVSEGPAFTPDASNTPPTHAPLASLSRCPGLRQLHARLLAVNHEYTDDGLLDPGGMDPWTAGKVAKSQAAHGVAIVEVAPLAPRPLRPITARTPIGSAPGGRHPLLRTAADPDGRNALGTLNNCAHGATPWAPYLTCEENFNGVLRERERGRARILRAQKRYGITKTGFGYRWHEHDPLRRRAAPERAEPVRLGRGDRSVRRRAAPGEAHGARTLQARGRRGGAGAGQAGRRLHGRRRALRVHLQVRQRGIRSGRTIAQLTAASSRRAPCASRGSAPTAPASGSSWSRQARARRRGGFSSQAEILVNARAAADRAGATKMDRPEWIAVHPRTGEVYCTLTNNTQRGGDGRPAADAANPRASNVYGHIVRWRERRRRRRRVGLRVGRLRAGGRPGGGGRRQARHRQGRRLRLA